MRTFITIAAFAGIGAIVAPTVATAQPTVSCNDSGQTASFAGGEGTTHTVVCPAGCTTGSVWGTGVYSDDSHVCVAAVHAGAISAGAGGTITVTIAAGQSSYEPSTANGVTTSSWGQWGRSFTVAGAGAPAAVRTVSPSCNDSAQTAHFSGAVGTEVIAECPAGCTTGSVWGTGTYSDDSHVCVAAVHAGAIQADSGGHVRVAIAAGLSSYEPSTANGVTTSSWGQWGRSFTVHPVLCSNTCPTANDNECDDGGPNSLYSICELGTDCNDCGPR